MTSGHRSLSDFFKEVWRRRVLQVAIPYGVGAWLLVQVAEIVLDAFEAPPWIMQGLLTILVLGFPVAVVLAWVFDFTPRTGITVTPSLADAESERLPAPDQETEPEPEPEPEPAPALAVDIGGSERRQVTVLQCAFEATGQDDPEVDPERLREAITAIQDFCGDLAERFGAQLMPAGAGELTLLFGYPQARDDDARRAVAAGLAIVDELQAVRARETSADAVPLSARVGVATGLVVVAEPEREGESVSVVGQAPRLSSWLMGQAAPDSVVVGPQTRALVQSHFKLIKLQVYAATSFGDELETFQAMEESGGGRSALGGTVLVAREDELERLGEGWDQVREGEGHFAVVSGDAGIGKSTLIAAFEQAAEEHADGRMIACQCSPYDRTAALHPVIEAFRGPLLGFERGDDAGRRLERLRGFLAHEGMDSKAEEALFAHLLTLDEALEHASDASPEAQRARMLEALADLFAHMAARKPLLLLFEDLQWADPSTLELLQKMVDRGPAPGLFVLLSTRPDFTTDWMKRSYVDFIELRPLNRKKASQLVQRAAGERRLPAELVERIVAEASGNPLFLQELTRSVVESGAWERGAPDGVSVETSWLVIPPTLQDSLAARIDNLGEAKALLQLCSVLGRQFSYRLLLAVSGTENEEALQQQLSRLVNAELLFQRGALDDLAYTFKHILIQEAAYQSLLKSKRRELHERIAQTLEEQADPGDQARLARLAHHYAAAGVLDKAIAFGTRAAKRSLDSAAHQEAMEQARRSLELVAQLPESPQRAGAEIGLQSVLGGALLATYGYANPDVQRAFSRALELCEAIGDAPQLFRVAVGLWMYNFIAGNLQEAFELSERLLRIAESTGDPAQHLQARYCLAFIHFLRADFETARSHLQKALDGEVEDCDYAAQSASGDDTRLHVRVLLSLVLWQVGETRKAREWVEQGIELARGAGHPFGVVFGLFFGAWLSQMIGDPSRTASFATEAERIATDKGFSFWMALVGFMQAWARSREGHGDEDGARSMEALEAMEACIERQKSMGVRFGLIYLKFQLAGECVAWGDEERAVDFLDRTRTIREASGEEFYEPEFERLQGRLCMLRNGHSEDAALLDDAEAHFRRSLELAEANGSRSLALRTGLDLAELLAKGGRDKEARQLLEGLLASFAGDEQAPDLDRARDLLQRWG